MFVEFTIPLWDDEQHGQFAFNEPKGDIWAKLYGSPLMGTMKCVQESTAKTKGDDFANRPTSRRRSRRRLSIGTPPDPPRPAIKTRFGPKR